MPLYLVDASAMAGTGWDVALRLAGERFPEVALEHRYADHHDLGREVWLCRAPSPDEVVRWAAAADIAVADVRRVDAVPSGPQGRPNRQEHR